MTNAQTVRVHTMDTQQTNGNINGSVPSMAVSSESVVAPPASSSSVSSAAVPRGVMEQQREEAEEGEGD